MMTRTGNFYRRIVACAAVLRLLVVCALAGNLVVDTVHAQFLDTKSLRAYRVDFYYRHAYLDQPVGFETIDGRQSGSISTHNDNSDRIGFRRVDDFNENHIGFGQAIIVDESGNIISVFSDFGDLHEFNIGFDDSSAGQAARSQAIDVVFVTWMSDQSHQEKEAEQRIAAARVAQKLQNPRNRHRLGAVIFEAASTDSYPYDIESDVPLPDGSQLVQPEGWALITGVRAFQREEGLDLLAEGGILERTSLSTVALTDVAGPQAGMVWFRRFGAWSLRLQGTALAGYNFGNMRQVGVVGEERIPGALNRPLYGQPIYTSEYQPASRFSPSGELFVETRWQLTDSIALRMSWASVIVENVLFTDDRIAIELPDFGLRDPGDQRLLAHNLFCGVEFVR